MATPIQIAEASVFGKITKGEIKPEYIYQDEKCVVIADINPVSPVHLLVLPRKPVPSINHAVDGDAELLGHLLIVAKRVAKVRGLKDGFRIVINEGSDGGLVIPHLHIHVFGGRPLGWPPC